MEVVAVQFCRLNPAHSESHVKFRIFIYLASFPLLALLLFENLSHKKKNKLQRKQTN